MKRKVLLLAIVSISIVTFLSSCKTHERCPAYGKISKPNTEKAEKPA